MWTVWKCSLLFNLFTGTTYSSTTEFKKWFLSFYFSDFKWYVGSFFHVKDIFILGSIQNCIPHLMIFIIIFYLPALFQILRNMCLELNDVWVGSHLHCIFMVGLKFHKRSCMINQLAHTLNPRSMINFDNKYVPLTCRHNDLDWQTEHTTVGLHDCTLTPISSTYDH